MPNASILNEDRQYMWKANRLRASNAVDNAGVRKGSHKITTTFCCQRERDGTGRQSLMFGAFILLIRADMRSTRSPP